MKKIIFANDSRSFREAAGIFLERAGYVAENGYKVIMCADGKEALDRYNSQKPVLLVIIDNQMPCMSGTELAKALKGEDSGLSVIMMSGKGLPEGAGEYVDIFLRKPFDSDDMKEIIERYAGKPGDGDSP